MTEAARARAVPMALVELREQATAAPGRRAATVVARRTARAAGRSGVLWGYVFGAFVASAAWSYTTIYKTQVEREPLAAGNSASASA